MKNRNSLITRITIAILATSFLYAFSGGLLNTLMNQIIDEFHLVGTSEGLMTSLISVGLMVTFLISPVFQGRAQKLTMLIVSAVFITAALLICGFAGKAVIFGIGSVLLGIGSGFLDGYANSTIIDLYPEDSSKPMGMLHGFYSIGSLIIPLIIQAILLIAIWRGAYFFVAVLFAADIIVLIIFRKQSNKNGGLKATEEQKLKFSDIRVYMKNKRNIILFIIGILTSMAQTGLVSWTVRYITLKYDNETIGAICVTIFWLAATLNRFAMPRLKVSRIKLLFAGCVAFAAAGAILVFVPVLPVACIAVGLCGLCCGHFCPFIMMIAAEGYKGNTTLTTSAMQFSFGIGRVAIPLLIAFVKTSVSLEAGMSLPAIAAILAFLCGVLILRPVSKSCQ